MSLLIANATVIDAVADAPAENQSVLIEDGRIKKIAPADRLEAPQSAEIIDASGKYLIPGLMDANVHLVGDIRVERIARHEDRLEDLVLEAAQIALKAGLTTVFDTWGPRRPLMAARDMTASGQAPGSRIFCAGNIIGLDGPYTDDFQKAVASVASPAFVERINALWVENSGPDLTWMTPEEVLEEVKAYIATGIDFVKYASSEHRSSGPTAFILFSPLVQKLIVEAAHAAGLTAQAHTTAVEALRIAVEAGSDIIQHANITGPIPIPQETLDLMVKQRTGTVVFPFTDERVAKLKNFPANLRRHWSTADDNVRAIIRSGAQILLGTDAFVFAPDLARDPALANSFFAPGEDNPGELGQAHFSWMKSMEQKGLQPIEMLRAATRNIAIAYGKDADLGTIESGKIADLLILEKNPLEDSRNYRTIQTVIKDGAIVDVSALPLTPILSKPDEPAPPAPLGYGKYAASKFPCCLLCE